jgi:hypothetical protein
MRVLAIRHVKIERLGLIEKRELDEYQFITVLGEYGCLWRE